MGLFSFIISSVITLMGGAGPVAATSTPAVRIAPGPALNAGLKLTSGWDYHAGDPSLDEIQRLPASAWQSVARPLWEGANEPSQGWNGRGWFRLAIDVAPEEVNRPLGLRLWQFGAVEVYVDSQKVGGFGFIGASSYSSWNPQGRPLSLVISTAGTHQLYIRYAAAGVGPKNASYFSRWWVEESSRASYRIPLGFKAQISEADEAFARAQSYDASNNGVLAVVLAILASFALVYGLFFVLRPQDKISLFSGLLVFTIAGAALGAFAARNGHFGLESILLARAANAFLRFFTVCAMVMFLGEATAAKRRWAMWCSVAAAAAVEFSRFIPETRPFYEPGLVTLGFCFMALSFTLLRAARNRVAEFGTLAVATVSLNLFVWMGILTFLKDFPPALLDVFRASFYLIFLGALIAYQARRFTATDKALQQLNEQLESRVEERTRELAESERKAQAGNEAKSGFLAMVSHEIRTPMNGVMGLSELLLQEQLDPLHRSYVETIATSANGLLTIVNDLLDVSKIEAGHLALGSSPLKLRSIVEDSVAVVASVAAAKGLRLTRRVDPSIPLMLAGDAARIRQILVNLLGNAVKFTKAGSVELDVTCHEPTTGDSWRILFSVADTGIGMTREHQANLFRSYYQAAPETLKLGGTGLGLVISKRLAEMMNGRIWVESELSKGSVFYCEIALTAVSAAALTQSDCAALASGISPVRYQILVADDNKINRLVTSKLLESLGHSVEVVENGLEVLSALERRHFDAILMDVQMPQMDGITATSQIHQTYGITRPKIIGLTANAMPADLLACIEAGMDACLAKPIPVRELQAAIASYLP